MTEWEQWRDYCKPTMDNMKKDHKELTDKVNDIHSIVMNGLKDSVQNNKEQIKALDRKIWYIMSGVVVSILLQILLRVL